MYLICSVADELLFASLARFPFSSCDIFTKWVHRCYGQRSYRCIPSSSFVRLLCFCIRSVLDARACGCVWCLSVCRSVCLSVCLCIWSFVCLSICLSSLRCIKFLFVYLRRRRLLLLCLRGFLGFQSVLSRQVHCCFIVRLSFRRPCTDINTPD